MSLNDVAKGTLKTGWGAAKLLITAGRFNKKKKEVRVPQGPQRRHLPAQAGSMKDRRDADALARLEAESVESVIEEGLWKHHRLLPPVEHSPRYQTFHALLRVLLYYNSFEPLLLGLEAADGDLSDGHEAYRAALASTNWESPTGPMTMDSNRQAIVDNYMNAVVEAEDGSLVLETIATTNGVSQGTTVYDRFDDCSIF